MVEFAEREMRDLSAKLKFALVSIVILPPLGATLTTLGVPRPVAGIVVFAGLALLLLAFVIARVSESNRVKLEDYEARKTAEIQARQSVFTAVEKQILRVTIRVAVLLAHLFTSEPVRIEFRH